MKKTPVMMKRFLFNVCALTAVLLPLSGGNALTAMASSAAADRQSFVQYAYPEQTWYRISTSYQPGIAVRESPDPNATLLTRLPNGTEFFVEAVTGVWGYTSMPDYSGWVNLDYAEALGQEPVYEAGMEYVITSDYQPGIALRSIPSSTGTLLTRLPKGTRFFVENVSGVWGYTNNALGYAGWVHLDYAQPAAAPEQFQQQGAPEDFYLLPYSSSAKITASDVQGFTLQQLCYARNEIYARHGRRFKSRELMEYFGEQSWYNGYIAPENFSEGTLSSLERANVQLLMNREHANGSPGYILDQAGYDISAVYPISSFDYSYSSETASGSVWDDGFLSEDEAYNSVYAYIDSQMDADTIYAYNGYIAKGGQTANEYVIQVRSYTGATGFYYANKATGDVYSAWRSPITGEMEQRKYEYTIT